MFYTQQEIDYLLSVSWMCRKEITALFNEKFNREKTHKQIQQFYKRRKLYRDFSRSPKQPNSGTFKKGRKAHNAMVMGQEYINPRNGLVMIKTEIGRVYKHHYNWGEPIPKGMFLTFKDGDKTNCEKDNLVLMNGSELLRFNQSYARISNKENRESLLLMAKIKCAVFEANKKPFN